MKTSWKLRLNKYCYDTVWYKEMKLFDTLLKSWDIIPKEKVQSERGSMWSEWKSRNNTMFTITLFIIKINIKTYYQSMVHAQLDWNERVQYILKKEIICDHLLFLSYEFGEFNFYHMSSNFIPRQIVNGNQLFYNLPL